MRFEVLGQPQGKARPRVTFRSGRAATYTPSKTVEYENQIKAEYIKNGGKCKDGEISATIIAVYQIPKSFNKAKRLDAVLLKLKPQTKPDLDNIAKAVLDSLNGVAYKDDSQVTSLFLKKYYGEQPKLIIYLEEIL